MADQVYRGSSRCRRMLTWALALVLLTLLGAGGIFFYLHTIGFPDFATAQLEDTLRSRGLSVRCGRIRWLNPGCFVAENIIASALQPLTGTVVVQRAELRLSQMNRLRFSPEVVRIDGAQLIWPVAGPQGTSNQLSFHQIQARARLLPDGSLEVSQASGRLLDADVRLSATITHASAMRSWRFGGRPADTPAEWQTRLDEFLTQVAAVRLAGHSVLELHVQGDGRDPSSFHVEMDLQTPRAVWPRGWIQNLCLKASTSPALNQPGRSKVQLQLCVDQAGTDWGQWHDLSLTAYASGSLTNPLASQTEWEMRLADFDAHAVTGKSLAMTGTTVPFDASGQTLRTELTLHSGLLQVPWGGSTTNSLSATFLHGLGSADPWEGQIRLATGPVQTRWGQSSGARIAARVSPRSNLDQPQHLDESSLGFWARLQPFQIDWEWDVHKIQSPKLEVESISCVGRWQTPRLTIQTLHAALYQGQLDSSGQLNARSREVQAKASFDFDARRVSPLLTKVSQRWLSQFGWQTPPRVAADWRVILPAWNDRHPDWRDEVMPTLELAGDFAGNEGTFRGIPVAYASSHFTLTNLVWHLPDLFVRRSDAEAKLVYTGHMRTHEYQWRIDGQAHPDLFRPLLESEAARRVLDQFEFTHPVTAQGEVWGRWHEPDSVGFSGRVAATNFLFRGQPCDLFTGTLRLGGSSLTFSDLVVQQGSQQITVPSGRYDLTERVVYLTNAISTMDPDLVTRVIGPKVRAAVKPYRFARPPTVRVNGRLPTFDTADADVRFEVAGESFSYWKLRMPSVTGDIRWTGDLLSLTNVQTSFYGGELAWHGDFDFSVPVGARLRFQGQFNRADLHWLMADLSRKTNQLEGSLDGQITITSANSDDWRSWQGSGTLRLRDGFLWDIPIFGVFSPALNKVVPGLGNSPISAGQASYKIDQSVVETKDLELKSPALRLRYTGSVDFQGKVDARMQAEILRDTWGIGRVLSLALWPISKVFEYKVTGTVDHPKSEPVYLPKAVTWALHPLKVVKRLFARPKEEPSAPVAGNFLFPPAP